MQHRLDRRDALVAAGAAGLAAVFGPRALALLERDADAATTCLLTPETTEGPYWVENRLTRRIITEGKRGVPLEVAFTVLNARTCNAIPRADVEIWHCDALGNYSGVNGARSRFLRGHQRTDARGQAEFLTIFPGWYPGRTPHIHLKVSVGGNAIHTGQVFFGEAITATVYRQPPYARRGRYDTSHARDRIYAHAGGSAAELRLRRREGGARGYAGRIVVGVVV